MYGYKVLERVGNEWVSPLYKSVWEFGAKTEAICRYGGHIVPTKGCTCGIYASKNVLAVTTYMRGTPSVVALGWGSGTTIVGENGYRCQAWEPVYVVDITPIEDESDLMWDTANRPFNQNVEITLVILGLEKSKQRSKECFEMNRKLRQGLGLTTIDLFQAETLIGDSWTGGHNEDVQVR